MLILRTSYTGTGGLKQRATAAVGRKNGLATVRTLPRVNSKPICVVRMARTHDMYLYSFIGLLFCSREYSNISIASLHHFTMDDTEMGFESTLVCKRSQTDVALELRRHAAFETLMLPQVSFIFITTSTGGAYKFFQIQIITSAPYDSTFECNLLR